MIEQDLIALFPMMGWRNRIASIARVTHLVKADGMAFCSVAADPVPITSRMIAEMPRVFPANMMKKLAALPPCGLCHRRVKVIVARIAEIEEATGLPMAFVREAGEEVDESRPSARLLTDGHSTYRAVIDRYRRM